MSINPYLWPKGSKLSFYNSRRKRLLTSTNRKLDLADILMLTWAERPKIAYFSVLLAPSADCAMSLNHKVESIESLIRYDLEFDGYQVQIKRLHKPKWHTRNLEHLWKIIINPNLPAAKGRTMKVYKNCNLYWDYVQDNKNEDKDRGRSKSIVIFNDNKITIKYDLDGEPQEYSGHTLDGQNYEVFMSDNSANGDLQMSKCKTFLEGGFTEDGKGEWLIELE